MQATLRHHGDLVDQLAEEVLDHEPAKGGLMVLGVPFGVVEVRHHAGAGLEFAGVVEHLREYLASGGGGHYS